MEQFKVCEKDTKTKAYSNEGIMRASRNDPKEAEKQDKIDWINSCLEKLQDLLESIEGIFIHFLTSLLTYSLTSYHSRSRKIIKW
jgi:CCR4-NOT transcriptional regulation complex NOT5 subunit